MIEDRDPVERPLSAPRLRRIVGAGAVVVAAACGTDTTAPPGGELDVQVRIEGPDSYMLGSLGDTVRLAAVATASEGTAPPVTWSSTQVGVAGVDPSGLVVAIGNGTARIIAAAGQARDTVSITVQQVPVAISFAETPPNGAAGIPLVALVVVRIFDANGFLAKNARDLVSVELEANPSGGSLSGTTSVSAVAGEATFDELAVDLPGADYTMRAFTSFGEAESEPFTVVDEPDLIRFHNLQGFQVGALLDGANPGLLNDIARVAEDSVLSVVLNPSGVNDEVVAFTRGRPPEILPNAPWTEGTDTVDVTFRAPIRISVTAWIVRDPFAALQDRATSQSITTTAVWFEERVGVEFDEFEIVDATRDPDAARIQRTTMCNQRTLAETGIGKRAGRINIYYVELVDGGRDQGYSCGDMIFMAEASGHELLVHEIGHSFGLGHVDNLAGFSTRNVMHSASSVRRYFTEGQLFRAHFDTFTALSLVYGNLPLGIRPCPDGAVSVRCMELGTRLWADGSEPITAARRDLAESWLLKSCEVGDAVPLTRDIAQSGDAFVSTFLEAFGRGPTPTAVRDVDETAAARFAQRQAVLLSPGGTGLSAADLDRARRVRRSDYLTQARDEFEWQYRSNALRALGLIGGNEAEALLRGVAADRRSPFAEEATAALELLPRLPRTR